MVIANISEMYSKDVNFEKVYRQVYIDQCVPVYRQVPYIKSIIVLYVLLLQVVYLGRVVMVTSPITSL